MREYRNENQRPIVRFWNSIDYIWWLPLGTSPDRIAELTEMRNQRLTNLHAYRDLHRKSMRGWPLVALMIRDVFWDVPGSMADTLLRLWGNAWVYRISDPLMVFVLLPALFITTGAALGRGAGVFVSLALLFGLLSVLIARLRRSARDPGGARLEADRQDAVWTLPNGLTFMRLVGIAFFPVLLYGSHPLRALALFAALAATDWADGFIARHYGMTSRLGKMLDPSTDRILSVVVVLTILLHGGVLDQTIAGHPVGVTIGFAMVAREAAVIMLGVVFLRPRGLRDEPRGSTHWSGKAGFTINCLGLVAVLSTADLPEWTHWFGLALLALGTVFNYLALFIYVGEVIDRRHEGAAREV